MKKNILRSLLLIVAFVSSTTLFNLNAQKVDSIIAYANGTKINKTAYWKVGKDYYAETWFGNIKGTATLATYGSNSFQIDWDLTI